MTAQGGMHTFSGDYDASAKRIVFTSKDSAYGMQDRTTTTDRRTTDRTTTTDRRVDGQDTDRQNNPRGNNQPDRRDAERQGTDRDRTTTTMASNAGMAIVLEMKNDNTYTITAYRGSTSVNSLRGERGADWGGQPALRGSEGNERGDSHRGDDARQSPNIVYKATYTKADESMRSQYERMIEEQEGQQRNRGAQNPSRR